MTGWAAARSVSELIDALVELGRTASIDPPGMSELDHGLQCAAVLRAEYPDDVELQVAGLVHDIGHRTAGDDDHGRAGAAFVAGVLGARVADLVEAHVTAKRYLAATDPTYATLLSAVSTATLDVQGGGLTPAERAAFEASPVFADALALRRADDGAKVPGRGVGGLQSWIAVLERWP